MPAPISEPPATAVRRNVGILIFDEVEVLDFTGPFEVFAVTNELNGGRVFNVFTVAESTSPIRARNGLRAIPDFTLATAPAPHVLIVPGGFGTRALLKNRTVVDWIVERSRAAELTMSVCTGALVLGQAGLLDGLRATTHHDCFSLLRQIAPRTTVVETDRFVDNGAIITAAGISAGIDCSLHVVERLLGADAATTTARYMEYRRS
jgi:transcriptional regulator GlxA family with amidase domain